MQNNQHVASPDQSLHDEKRVQENVGTAIGSECVAKKHQSLLELEKLVMVEAVYQNQTTSLCCQTRSNN